METQKQIYLVDILKSEANYKPHVSSKRRKVKKVTNKTPKTSSLKVGYDSYDYNFSHWFMGSNGKNIPKKTMSCFDGCILSTFSDLPFLSYIKRVDKDLKQTPFDSIVLMKGNIIYYPNECELDRSGYIKHLNNQINRIKCGKPVKKQLLISMDDVHHSRISIYNNLHDVPSSLVIYKYIYSKDYTHVVKHFVEISNIIRDNAKQIISQSDIITSKYIATYKHDASEDLNIIYR